MDYTNANGTLWTGGAPGRRNSYRRAINGGVFAEWGYTDDVYYSDSDWEDERYWAFEPYYDEEKGHHGQYYVYTFAGQVYYGVGQGGQGVRAACVNP